MHESEHDEDRHMIHGWELTRHVRRRLRERQFTLAQLRDALEHPEYCRLQWGKWLGREERQRGHITAVINPATREVITVLFRDHRHYERHLAARSAA